MPNQTRMIVVQLHEGVSEGSSDIRGQISSFCSPEIFDMCNDMIQMRVSLAVIDQIADLDGVRSIGLDHPVSPDNYDARDIMSCDTAWVGELLSAPALGSQSISLAGEGQLVTVVDTGFDIGSTTDVHPAFGNRVKYIL